MVLYIDRAAVTAARFVNLAQYEDARRYYLIATPHGDAIIICRNGLVLESLAGQMVDCATGWEVAQEGFAIEAQIGQRRTRVTIFRVAQGRGDTLTETLNAPWKT